MQGCGVIVRESIVFRRDSVGSLHISQNTHISDCGGNGILVLTGGVVIGMSSHVLRNLKDGVHVKVCVRACTRNGEILVGE